jgi:putative tricarboxylic transport membrane protein
LSSILINTPGDGSAVAATFDGYQMAKQGRAGPAIAITAIGSLIGGAVAVIGFMVLAKPLASFALQFGPAEYFLLMLFTLSAVVALSTGNLVKGFISMGFGLMLSTIGIDLQTGVYRFTFDNVFLSDGIDFLVIIIGVYAIGEVLYNYLTIDKPAGKKTKYGRVWITKDDWKRSKWPIFRSSPLGFLVGILPGAGGSIASMMAYSTEKQLSKKPERFGKGAIEGLAAPETANNSAAVGAFVPLLTMGIPGSGTTAIMLGALIMLGINPGPLLFESDPNMVWSLVDALFLGNIFLFLINIYMVRVFVKVLDIPSKILYPIILVLAFIGAYTMNYAIIDFYILIIFGVIGLFMKLYDFPIAPLVLALIVGSQMEQNFRKSIVASDGSLDIFVGSPIAIVLLILTILSLIYPLIMNVRRKKWEAKTDEQSSL